MPRVGQAAILYSWDFLAASLAIVVLGLADDRFTLRGRHKLFGQFLTVAVLLTSGIVVREIQIGTVIVPLGLWSMPLTALWLVFCINGINLVDGQDGIAATVGITGALALSVMAALNGEPWLVVSSIALAASLLGFLPWNLPPARFYLGDAGSMFIGLMLGVLTIVTAVGPGTQAVALAPFVVWTLPLFDTLAAVARRRLTGRSVYVSDRGHLHHCLAAWCRDSQRTVAAMLLLSTVVAAIAVAGVAWRNDLIAVAGGAAVVGGLMAIGVFGRLELQLATQRLYAVIVSLRQFGRGGIATGRQTIVLDQGGSPWDQFWIALVESIDPRVVQSIQMNVYPCSQGAFQASWEHPRQCETDRLWRTEIPLHAGDRLLGRLTIAGVLGDDSVQSTLGHVRRYVDHLESTWLEMLGDPVPAAASGVTEAVAAAGGRKRKVDHDSLAVR